MKTNRVHTAAKKAGITRIGCYEPTRDAVRKGCAVARERTGISVEPRDVLAAFGSAEELFADIATAWALQQGYRIKTQIEILPPGNLRCLDHGAATTGTEVPPPTAPKRKKSIKLPSNQEAFF